MKKITLVVTLFINLIGFSQTNVSGGIASNSTWVLENSPYIVTGDIAVFQGYTLTIEPGVTVKFEDNTKIIIRGSIVAIGNNSNNITFTSNNPSPQKGSWNRIEFDINASFTFDYVLFEYADSALRYDHTKSSSIKNSNFQYNNNGIEVNNGGPQWGVDIENTIFSNNDKGIANFHDEVNLKNCEFKNNRIGAELTESYIDSCLFDGNTDLGLEVWSTKLRNSTFTNNNVALEKNFMKSFFVSEMTGNTIKYNTVGVKVGYYQKGVDISNNTICSNSQYDVIATRSNNADFSNNCWCTEDISEIEKAIYHGLDDINVGLVNFDFPSMNCPDSTNDSTDLNLSNDDIKEAKSIAIYPNPAYNELNINLSPNTNFIFCEIYNVSGRKIMESDETNFLIANLPSSTYIIKILTSEGVIIERFIKK